MSFFPDITPLTKEIQAFKDNQQKQLATIIALLEEIRNIKNTSIDEDKIRNSLKNKHS